MESHQAKVGIHTEVWTLGEGQTCGRESCGHIETMDVKTSEIRTMLRNKIAFYKP